MLSNAVRTFLKEIPEMFPSIFCFPASLNWNAYLQQQNTNTTKHHDASMLNKFKGFFQPDNGGGGGSGGPSENRVSSPSSNIEHIIHNTVTSPRTTVAMLNGNRALVEIGTTASSSATAVKVGLESSDSKRKQGTENRSNDNKALPKNSFHFHELNPLFRSASASSISTMNESVANYRPHIHPSEYYLKVIVIGGPSVGKSSLVRSYCYSAGQQKNQSLKTHKPTQGIDLHSKLIKQTDIMAAQFQMNIRVQLFDIPHQTLKNENQLSHVLQDVHGILLMFDITNPKSLLAVDQWRAVLPTNHGASVLLIAHKSDKSGHIIQKNGLDAYIRDCGYIGWHMTSVTSESSVKDAVNFLLDRILKQMYKRYRGLPLDRGRLVPAASPISLISSYNKHISSSKTENLSSSRSQVAVSTTNRTTDLVSPETIADNSYFTQLISDENIYKFYLQDIHADILLNDEETIDDFKYMIKVKEEVEHDFISTIVATQQQQKQTDDNTLYLDKPEIRTISIFYSEMKTFYDQIIARFEEYKSIFEQGKQHERIPTKHLILRSLFNIAKYEEAFMLDKIVALLTELIQNDNTSHVDANGRITNKNDKIKRVLVELKREFYTISMKNWYLLWYSLRCEALLSQINRDEMAEGFNNENRLLQSIQKIEKELERKQNAKLMLNQASNNKGKIQEILHHTDNSQFNFPYIMNTSFSSISCDDAFPTIATHFRNILGTNATISTENTLMMTAQKTRFRFNGSHSSN